MNTLRMLSKGVVVSAFVGGCSAYHMYEGPQRAMNEVSTVTQTQLVTLMTIDGGDTGVSKEFKLAPGEHAISVAVYKRRGSSESTIRTTSSKGDHSRTYICTCEIKLRTEVGRRYHVQGGPMGDVAGAWVTDSQEHHNQPWTAVAAFDPPHCRCSHC